jgi:hypothetical protein
MRAISPAHLNFLDLIINIFRDASNNC